MTKGDVLKDCLCGSGRVTIAPDRMFNDPTWVVKCKACGLHIARDLEEQAITAWNTRSQK